MKHRKHLISIPESLLSSIIRKTIDSILEEYDLIPYMDVVHLHLKRPLNEDEALNHGFVVEAKMSYRPIPGTNYTYRFDKPRGVPGPGNLKHAHIYSRNGQILAMNIDGTAHDGYHHVEIPLEVADFLRNKGFTIPKDNVIEVVTYNPNWILLLD